MMLGLVLQLHFCFDILPVLPNCRLIVMWTIFLCFGNNHHWFAGSRVKSLKQRSRIGAMEDPTQGSLQAPAHCIQQLVLEKKLYALKTHRIPCLSHPMLEI